MRRTCAILIVFILGNIMAACSSSGPLRSGSPARPTDPTLGRWEIIPSQPSEFPENGTGWKNVRIPVSIENRTNRFAHALIPVGGSQLYIIQTPANGTLAVNYSAELWETKGSGPVLVKEINYLSAGPMPPRLRIAGVYINNAVSLYFFQSRIPTAATSVSLGIPGYPDHIPLPQPSTTPIPISNQPPNYGAQATKTLGQTFDIPGKATLVVTTITTTRQMENSFNRIAHDRITVTLTVKSTNSLSDSEVNIEATAIGNKDIMGSALYDEVIGCAKPPFRVGPTMPTTRMLCAILPYNSTGVRVILTGDVNEVYVPGF